MYDDLDLEVDIASGKYFLLLFFLCWGVSLPCSPSLHRHTMPHLPRSPSLAPPCYVGSTGVFHGETCVVIVSTKWLLCIHDAVVFKTKILHFKVKDSLLKHTNKKGKFSRTLIFLFVDKEAFITKSSLEKFNLVFMEEQMQIFWRMFRYILYTMVITCLFFAVNALATSPDDDMDLILNHVPLSPSSTIPPNSPGTPGTPGTPVTPTTPVTPGVGTKISLVIVIQTCYWILVKR